MTTTAPSSEALLAYEQLATVYDRFTEGFGTADLIEARRLLDELGNRFPR